MSFSVFDYRICLVMKFNKRKMSASYIKCVTVIIKSRDYFIKIMLDVSIDFHTINANVQLDRKHYKIDHILNI